MKNSKESILSNLIVADNGKLAFNGMFYCQHLRSTLFPAFKLIICKNYIKPLIIIITLPKL